MNPVLLKIRDILTERNEIRSFAELGYKLTAAPQRKLEFNAVKTALEQVGKHNNIDFYNRRERELQDVTIQTNQPG